MITSLVVLSGGQDSTTCLALAVAAQSAANVAAVTFDYGQRHARELQAATDVCRLLGVMHHEIVRVGNILNGTSPLTNAQEQLETYPDFATMDRVIGNRVEKTFVPMRNALFLTLAANRAACLGATQLWTGVCQEDNANYPDCRSSFIYAQENAINEALGYNGRSRIEIVAPLIDRSKARAVKLMEHLNQLALLAWTHTAYDGAYPPVGKDHASVLRAHGFEEAGLPDPLVLRACMEGLMDLPATANYADPVLLAKISTDIREFGRRLSGAVA